MKFCWVRGFLSGLVALWITGGTVAVSSGQSVTPRVCCGAGIEYLGAYSSDGKFRTATRTNSSGLVSRVSSTNLSENWSRSSEVPGFINLHPRERVEENYEPPAQAVKPIKGRSTLASVRDSVVTFVYGRERLLLAPHHVAVDSRGRMLIVDPEVRAVHVLGGEKPFRIEGGPRRRLHLPNGIAVDGEDNIYIADSERGLVLVYDSEGRFLRYIGKRGDESLFHGPTAIAIDRASQRLFLLDTPRNILFVLDLEGNVLKRVGRRREHAIGKSGDGMIRMDLYNPTEMAVGNNELVVADSGNSRIHVMDMECNPVAQFEIPAIPGPHVVDEVGLGVDLAGNIYVSTIADSRVRIFGRDGVLLGSFGRMGGEVGEFNSPTGLWIDGKNRLYVSDTNNSRVQVFQLSSGAGTQPKVDSSPAN